MIQSILDFDINKLFGTKCLIYLIFSSLFIVSLLNQWVLLGWMIIIPFAFVYKYGLNDGFLLTLLVYQLRQMCNNEILSVPITSVPICQIVYYIVILIISVYFIIHINTERTTVSIIYYLLLFSIYTVISSSINSSYPVVAFFKTFLYIIPFIGILCGISNSQRNDWIDIIFILLCSYFVLNLIFIPNHDAYLHSTRELFRGISAHSNQLGFLCVLFQAIIWTIYKNMNVLTFILTASNFIILYLTMARGQIIAILLLSLIYFLTYNINLQQKAILVVLFLIILVLFHAELMNIFTDIMNSKYKTQSSNAFVVSRQGQFERIFDQFKSNPLMGTGFNVPYVKGLRDTSFYFSLPVEDGNLFFALLCQSGIIGFILFFLAYGRIFINGKGALLFFSPILICISEMTFFSTNNVGILLYFFYAIYISNGVDEHLKRNIHSQSAKQYI